MTQVAVRRLAGGRARLTGVVLALAAATALPACAGGGPSEGQSVDPWAVARELDRAAASASASAQASRDAALGPDLVALREAALAMEAPSRPAQMDQDDATGAMDSATYFVSLYQYAYVTGDLSQWEEMSEDRCDFCQSVVDNVTRLHADGGWADPWAQDVTYVEYWDPVADSQYSRVHVTMSSGAGNTYNGDASVVNEVEAPGEEVLMVAMRYVDGRWMVGGAEVQK